MNEELQKQLIQILQSMKDNANPAFQELVMQRSGYFGAMAQYDLISVGIASAAILLGIILTILGFKHLDRKENSGKYVSEGDTVIYAVLPITIAIGGIIPFFFKLTDFFSNSVAAQFPLGQVLSGVLH